MLYLLIFILLTLTSLSEGSRCSRHTQRLFQILLGMLFVFVAGLRYETGVDWRGYQYYFDQIIPLDQAYKSNNFGDVFLTLDIGYSLLNSTIKMLGGSLQSVFLTVSVLSTVILIKNLRYYSNSVLMGLLIYYSYFFFIFDLSGLRQGLALQIFLFSLRYIGEEKFSKYLLCILIAASMHWSALLLLPLYWFLNSKISVKITLALFIVATFVFSFQIKWLGTILGDLMSQLNVFTLLADKVEAHTTSETLSQARVWDLYSIFNYIRISGLIYLSIKFMPLLTSRVKYFNIFYNLLLIEFFSFFCLYEFNVISERLRFYFFVSELILMPNIVYCFRKNIAKRLAFFLCISIVFLNSYPYLLNFPSTVAYHPYQNILIYNIFDLKSDGESRLDQHIRSHE